MRTAKKKKDKAGRKLGKGGNVGEGLRKTSDLSLRDTSNFVLWEYSVCWPSFYIPARSDLKFRRNTRLLSLILEWAVHL